MTETIIEYGDVILDILETLDKSNFSLIEKVGLLEASKRELFKENDGRE